MPKIPASSAIQVPRVATPSGRLDAMSINTLDRMQRQLFGFARQYKQQQQQAEMVQISGDMERELLDLRLEIEQNPEINSAETAGRIYSERAKTIVGGATEQSNWKSVQTMVAARGASTLLRGAASVSRVGYAREVDASKAQLDSNMETYAQSFATAEDEDVRATALSRGIADININPYISEQEKGKRLEVFEKMASLERAAVLNEKDPAALMGMIDDENEFPGLLESQRITIKSKAKAQLDGRIGSDLEIAVNRASTIGQVRRMRGEVASVYEDDSITDAKRTQLVLTLDRIEQEIQKQGQSLMLFSMGMNGEPLNPGDSDTMDAVNAGYTQMMQMATPEQRESVESKIIDTLNIVPEPVIDRMQATLNSDYYDHIAQEAERFAEYRESSPQIIDQFSPQDLAVLENVVTDRTVGITAADSIQRTREIMKVDDATLGARRKMYDEIQRTDTDWDWLRDQGNFATVHRPFWPDKEVPIPDTWSARFAASAEKNYQLEPDINKARTRAFNELQRTVGVSTVGGREQLMVLPPELAYPQFQGNADAMTQQLRSDVATVPESLMASLGIPGFENVAPERIAIASDFLTPREIDPTTGAPRPGYPVFVVDDEDEMIPLMNSETGLQHRFYPEYQSSSLETESLDRIMAARAQEDEALELELESYDRNLRIADETMARMGVRR